MLGGSWRATTIKDSNKTAASTAVVFIWAFRRIVDLWRVHRLQSLTVMVTSKYLSTKGVCKLPANPFTTSTSPSDPSYSKAISWNPFDKKKLAHWIAPPTLPSQNNETPFATTIPLTVSPPQLFLGQRPANWDHSPNDPTAPRDAAFAARYVWHGPTRWSLIGSKGSREGSRKFDVLSYISTPTCSERHAFSTHFDGFLMVYEKAVYISFHDPFLKTEVQDSLAVGVFRFLGWMNILNSRRSRPFTSDPFCGLLSPKNRGANGLLHPRGYKPPPNSRPWPKWQLLVAPGPEEEHNGVNSFDPRSQFPHQSL